MVAASNLRQKPGKMCIRHTSLYILLFPLCAGSTNATKMPNRTIHTYLQSKNTFDLLAIKTSLHFCPDLYS